MLYRRRHYYYKRKNPLMGIIKVIIAAGILLFLNQHLM